MNNEEKILSMLEALTGAVSQVQSDIVTLKVDIVTMKGDIVTMKGDIEAIKDDLTEVKEDVEITRSAANLVLDWADRAQKIVNIPLAKV